MAPHPGNSTENPSLKEIEESIPKSESEELLQSWGYNLTAEYLHIVRSAGFASNSRVLELATGTGRMTAILTRLGFTVYSGDVSSEKHKQALDRLSSAYASSVQFLLLNMESLPFRSGSIDAITCINTLHELENPQQCLEELLRIQSPEGTIVLGDFNKTGFEAVEKVHQVIYGDSHPLGSLKITDAEVILKRAYSDLEMVVTPLNITYIASRKK